MNGTLITITGPSLTGKTTLQNMLGKEGVSEVVSFTTRPKREGEKNGKDYWFITQEELAALLRQNKIAEHISFNGNNYGILGTELEGKTAGGQIAAVVVEPNGVIQLNNYCKDNDINHLSVFISNPQFIIFQRFLERFKNDSNASTLIYASRLETMIKEEKDWMYAFDYDIIFNRFDKQNEVQVVHTVLAGVEMHKIMWH